MNDKTPIEEYADARMSGGQQPEETTPKKKTPSWFSSLNWKAIGLGALAIMAVLYTYKLFTSPNPGEIVNEDVASIKEAMAFEFGGVKESLGTLTGAVEVLIEEIRADRKAKSGDDDKIIINDPNPDLPIQAEPRIITRWRTKWKTKWKTKWRDKPVLTYRDNPETLAELERLRSCHTYHQTLLREFMLHGRSPGMKTRLVLPNNCGVVDRAAPVGQTREYLN